MHSSAVDDEQQLREALTRLVERCLDASLDRLDELEPGLGRRRFFRLSLSGDGPASVIARMEPVAAADDRDSGIAAEPALEPLRTFLATRGLPVPAHYGSDPEIGVVLLEDLGTNSLERAVSSAPRDRRIRLYEKACALVPRLQGLSAPPDAIPAFARRLDAPLIKSKGVKFAQWVLPWGLARPARPAEREVVQRAFTKISRECADAPMRLAHRDFKAANLHLRTLASGAEELVMIDLQGALLAAPEYDLVCLLRDSHVLLPEDEVRTHLQQSRPLLPDAPHPDAFERRFTLLTLARVAKDLSHYLHAAHERGDQRYLRLVPTALRNLRGAAQRAAAWHEDLQALADLIHSVPEPNLPDRISARTSSPTDSPPDNGDTSPCGQ